MSDDPRREAAEVARQVRRRLERELARGGAELLAAGIAGARRRIVASEAPDDYTATVAAAQVEATPATDDVPAPGSARPVPAQEPSPMPARTTSTLPDFELPPFTEVLWPAAMGEARAGLQAEAQPLLDAIAGEVRGCERCGLCRTRTQAVPGIGSARSGIVFVGEAPGADEDQRGEPFVGRAGELLTQMIAGMQARELVPGVPLSRESVYIANVLKCRPPENRNPLPHEIESCSPYLMRQLEALRPRVICCLGKFAAELLLGVKGTIASMRGKTYRWRGAKLLVTYHPAYCLRNPNAKKPVWDDLQRLAREYLAD